MRNAPSVTYPVGRCVFHGVLLVLLSGLGAAALAMAWWWSVAVVWIGGGVLLWLLWSLLVLRMWWHSPTGLLQWDARSASSTALPGERPGVWRWHETAAAPAELLRVEWVLDAQAVSLLRLHAPVKRPLWVWLEARREPGGWDNLRRALTAHTRSAQR